jgi:FkbM family methyltransferase
MPSVKGRKPRIEGKLRPARSMTFSIKRALGPKIFLVTEWVRYLRALGLKAGIRILRRLRLPYDLSSDTWVGVPGITRPVFIRSGTSDIRVFRQIFIAKDYDLELPLKREAVKVIVDGGANTGCSTAYFASTYPDAHVIAIEPEASNFEVLSSNTRDYANVFRIQAAIWRANETVWVGGPDVEKWAVQVVPGDSDGAKPVRALTMDEILKLSHETSVDLLKLDVEGAEREIFSGDCGWLERVKLIVIELHDRMKPGCSEAVFSAASRYGFVQLGKRGENVLLGKKSYQVAMHPAS